MKKQKTLSKRILSIVLSLLMVLSLIPMSAFSAGAVLNVSHSGGCDGDHSGYTAITGGRTTITAAGNYYIANDINYSDDGYVLIKVNCSGEVNICLCGHTVYHSGVNRNAIKIESGTVNLCDCVGTSNVKTGNSSAIYVSGDSTLNMYGGNVKNSYGYRTSSIFVYDGTFNMYGGTISENTAGYKSVASAVCIGSSSTFNMYGGSIVNNKIKGVEVDKGATVNLFGNSVIRGNSDENLYLYSGAKINNASGLTDGAEIYVTAVDGGDVAITGENPTDISKYFHSDDDRAIINEAEMGNVVMLHKHNWQAATCKTAKYCGDCGQYEGEPDLDNHESEKTYFKFIDDSTHSEYYACCDAVKETAPHNADIEANCGAVAYCGACNSSFGEVNPDNHTTDDTYCQIIDDDSHGLYHICCDGLISTENHTPDNEATCTNQMHCSECNSVYGETNGENHTGELVWSTTNYNHIKKWTCCGATEGVTETHTPEFTVSDDGSTLSAICSVCKADLGSCSINFADDGVVYDGKVHKAGMEGYIYCAYGDNSLKITYWQNGEQLNTTKTGGVSGAGTYTVRLGLSDNSVYIEKEVTINKRELTVDSIYISYKEYDGTNVVDAYSASFNNVVEGEELYSGVYGTIVVNDNKVGYYETVKGVEEIHVFASTIASYYGDNYYVTVDPEAEYPVAGGGCYIDQRTLTVTAHNQSITEGEDVDQSAYTLENLLEDYECSGIALETNDYNNVIDVNTSNAVITYNGEDLTENFYFNTYSGILETVCANHYYDEDGFCATRECGVYQTPEYTLDEYGAKTYVITNAGELYFYAQQVNVYGQTGDNAVLDNDIVIPLTESQGGTIPDWTPIDNLYAEFDGKGHTISGVYCKSDASYVGFFGYTGYYPIKNLIITNSYFEGPSTVGAIAGYSQAEIINCGVTDSVTVAGGEYSVGAFVGDNSNSIRNSFAMADSFVGYSSESYGAVLDNCYYIGTDDSTSYAGTTAVSKEAFASGETAYLLQAGIPEEDVYDDDWNVIDTIIPEIWGQKIGTDAYPVIGGDKVYQVKNCIDEIAYSNTDKTLDHSFENGKCTLCGELDGIAQVAGYSIDLGGKIAVNYYMLLADEVINDANAKMVFTVPDTGSTYTSEVPVSEAVKSGDYYVFNCEVAAKEMTSKISAKVVTNDSESDVFEYSVKQYAEYILANPETYDEKTVNIVKAMLNYGASAQVYFDYNADNLANDSEYMTGSETNLGDIDLSSYQHTLTGEQEGVSFYGAVLSLKSETAIKVYFRIEDETALDNITVNGETVAAVENGSYYEIKISDIPAHKLGDMYEIKVGGLTLNYGAFSYGYAAMNTSNSNLIEVIKAMYAYNQEVLGKFNVVLTSFGDSKLAVIKVVKDIKGISLSEASDLVNSAPVVIMENLYEGEAKALKATLEEAGATVQIISTDASSDDTPEDSEGASDGYDVVLVSYNSDSKLSTISAVIALTGIDLAEAKALVESVPSTILSNVSEADAENAKARLEGAGATVEIIEPIA